MIQFSNRVRAGQEDVELAVMKVSAETAPRLCRHDAADRQAWRIPPDVTASSFRDDHELVEEFERWDGLA